MTATRDEKSEFVKQEQFNTMNGRIATHHDEIVGLNASFAEFKRSFEQYQKETNQHQIILEQMNFLKVDNVRLWRDVIQRHDTKELEQLIARQLDPTGVSFITFANELKKDQIDELRKKGGIFTIEELEKASNDLLSNLTAQPPKRRVIERLQEGITHLLELWRTGKLPDTINAALLQSGVSALQPLLAAERLPENLNKWMTDCLHAIQMEEYEKWLRHKPTEVKESKTTPSHSATDELTETELTALVEDRIWGQWKTGVAEAKTGLSHESMFAGQLESNVCDIVVARLRQGKLPEEVTKTLWENISKIIFIQLKRLNKQKLDKDLEKVLVAEYKAMLPQGEAVYDADHYYQLALNKIFRRWSENQLNNDIVAKLIQQFVESFVTNELKLTGDLRSEVDREAVKLLLKQFHSKELSESLNTEIERISKNIQITKKAKESEKNEALKRMLVAWQQGKFIVDDSQMLFQATTKNWQMLLQKLQETLNPFIKIARLEQQILQLQAKLHGQSGVEELGSTRVSSMMSTPSQSGMFAPTLGITGSAGSAAGKEMAPGDAKSLAAVR